jgi:DNA primase
LKDTEKFAGAKYVIRAKYVVKGVVEKHDVIGAIFGQTEGLFPKEFELRELQKSGKIGRIDIELHTSKDKTNGLIVAPSSLDRAETAIIAAAMETVDRVGPYDAGINIQQIKDIRSEKREQIVKRAKELMRDWVVQDGQEIDKILTEVQKEDKKIKAVHYGRQRLTATPDISKSKEIIVVEGRADVNNLIKSGVSGVIAMEGVKVPNTIKNLINKKEVTAFLDGDRGGDLILQEMLQVAKPDYVARAPWGKEVEELTPDEVRHALDEKISIDEIIFKDEIIEIAQGLRGTLEAVLMKKDGNSSDRIPVSDLVKKLREADDVQMVVFDGIVTGRVIDTAKEKNISTIIGERVAEGVRIPRGLEVKSFQDLR